MIYEFYVTPDEYLIAEQNGISPANVDSRIRRLGWRKKRALTEPCRKRTDLSKLAKIAQSNGIPYRTMQRRIERGWTPEEAATRPLIDKVKQIVEVQQNNRIYPQKYVERANENGIRYPTFTERMRQGWTLEEASETRTFGRGTGRGKQVSPWSKEKRMVGMWK